MNKTVLSLKERIEYDSLRASDSSIPTFEGRKIGSTTMYIAGIGSDILERGLLIDGATKKKVGYTNFPEGNKLPAGMELGVFAVRALFDTTTPSVTPLIAKWKDNPDVSWLNGEFKFNQGSTAFSTPITDLANIKASASNDNDFRAVTPFAIRSMVEFEPIVILAGGAANTTAWKIEFRCDVYTSQGF